jgi:hypothetical protein
MEQIFFRISKKKALKIGAFEEGLTPKGWRNPFGVVLIFLALF